MVQLSERGYEVTDYKALWLDTFGTLKASQIEAQGFTEADVRAGGRATKEYPNKEDETWWLNNGVPMVQQWVTWRDNSGWGIADMGDGKAGIEIGMEIYLGGIKVQMYVDRVMFKPNPSGVLTREDYIVLDLKTGKYQPKSEMQLALYATGIEMVYGFRPKWGVYWMAREGQPSPLIDLDNYSREMFEDIFGQFKRARENGVFPPNFSHCAMCSVIDYCKYKQPNLLEIQK